MFPLCKVGNHSRKTINPLTMNNEKSACCGAPVEIYDSDENGNTFWQCSKCNLRCKTYRERSVGVVAPKENYIGGAEDVKCPKCGVLMLREAKGLRCMNCEPGYDYKKLERIFQSCDIRTWPGPINACMDKVESLTARIEKLEVKDICVKCHALPEGVVVGGHDHRAL